MRAWTPATRPEPRVSKAEFTMNPVNTAVPVTIELDSAPVEPASSDGRAPGSVDVSTTSAPDNAHESGREVLMIVSNAFYSDDGWHDIRVHKFAKSFQARGFNPIVLCRTYPGATTEEGVYDGIRFRRMRFKPVVSATSVASAKTTEGSATNASTPDESTVPTVSTTRERLKAAAKRAPGPARFLVRTARFCLRNARRVVRKARNYPKRLWRRFWSKYLTPLNFDFHRAVLETKLPADPAFVYTADLNTLRLGSRLAKKTYRVPFLYDSHEYFLSQASHNNMNPLRKIINKMLVLYLEWWHFRGATVISVSPSIIKAFKRRMPWGKYLCIRNLPRRSTRVIVRRNLVREKLGLSDDIKIAMYIGFITGGRGMDEMIASARYLDDDVVIAFLGKGRLEEETREKVKAAGLEHKVHFLGHVPQTEVLNWAESADCSLSLIQPVCTSYYFCLPNKVFQSIHGGLPVLCSDFPDMRELVERRGVGRWVDPTDPEAIGREINLLVKDEEGLQRMRAACLEAVADEINWETECQALNQIDFLNPQTATV